nr:MAG TPA: dsDNA helicase [Caudoviricetes sp.]
MGDYLIKKYHLKRIINENLLDGAPPDDVDIYFFNPKNNNYEPFSKLECNRLIILEDKELRTNARKEVWEYIKSITSDCYITNPHIVGCLNCLVNIMTGEVLQKTPGTILRNYIPVKYDPKALENDVLDAFVKNLFGEDREMHTFIYQIIAYGLWPDNHLQKFFILFGGGGNGKSTFIKLLKLFYGYKNISVLELAKFGDDRYIGTLYGKMVNLGDDIEANALLESAVLKKAVSGEPVHANPKFGLMFAFVVTQKLLFSANLVPRITDTSQGMADRLIVIPFTQRIRETARAIPNVVQAIVKSGGLSVLLNRVLKEVPNIINRINIPELVQVATKKHMTDTNPVALFVSDMNENGWRVDTGSSFEGLAANKDISDLTTVQVYNLYKEWCKENGYKPLANNTFGRELSRLGYESIQIGTGLLRGKRAYQKN